jgi:hypothetical protein
MYAKCSGVAKASAIHIGGSNLRKGTYAPCPVVWTTGYILARLTVVRTVEKLHSLAYLAYLVNPGHLLINTHQKVRNNRRQ